MHPTAQRDTSTLDRTERFIPLALAGIIVFQLLLAVSWIRTDATPPYWDEAWYLYQGAVQYDSLSSANLSDWYTAWTELDRSRPSLVPTLTIPFYALFGINSDAGLLVNLAALVLLLLATYGLGASLGGRRTGLLAALLVGSYPVLVGLIHILLVELVMVALVAATLLALWLSNGFRHRGWSIIAGTLFGTGLLTKVFFAVFLVGPWLVTALQVVQHTEGGWRRDQTINLLASVLGTVIVASFWYIPNLGPMLERSLDAGIGAEAAPYGPADPLRWVNLRNYFLSFVGTGTSFIGVLAFLVGCAGLAVTGLRARNDVQSQQPLDRQAVLFLASSVVVGYAIFTSLTNQDMKHVTGILPAMAVLSGWGITRLFRRWWTVVAGAILALSLLLVVAGTAPGPLQNWRLDVPVSNSNLMLLYPAQPAALDTRYASPDSTPWPLEPLLSYALFVADLRSLPRDRARIGVIPNHPGIEEHGLRFEAYRRRIPVVMGTALVINLADQDVLIHKTGDWGWVPSRRSIRRVMAALAQPDSEFQRMPRTFALPDGSEAILYARKPSPLLAESPSPAYPTRVEFGDAARFLGFDVQLEDTGLDEQTVIITYYWESMAATEGDHSVFVHLLDPDDDEMIAQDDHALFSGVYPTSMWQAGRFLFERRAVKIPNSFSGLAVRLRLGLYNQDGRLPATSGGDTPASGATFADVGLIPLNP